MQFIVMVLHVGKLQMKRTVHAFSKQCVGFVEHAYRVSPLTLIQRSNGGANWRHIAHAGNAMTLKQENRACDAFGVIS